MSPLAEFLHHLFDSGQVIFHERPVPARDRCADSLAILTAAHAGQAIHIAGPAIPFDEPTALAAAEVLRQACWFLVSRREPEDELARLLCLPGPPSLPAQHLSADLLLRYLPQVHRRAAALQPGDRLTELLADLLRHWPLSGVLSDVTEPPLTDLTFGDHDGLLLLYAERLAAHEKPAWLPPPGRGREFVELVARERERRP